jgi:hypothetical protein
MLELIEHTVRCFRFFPDNKKDAKIKEKVEDNTRFIIPALKFRDTERVVCVDVNYSYFSKEEPDIKKYHITRHHKPSIKRSDGTIIPCITKFENKVEFGLDIENNTLIFQSLIPVDELHKDKMIRCIDFYLDIFK